MQRSDILIVGAGPAGLAAAFWAQRRDPHARVTVLEQGRAPGGWVHSEEVDGYLCERGPQGLRPDAAFDEFAATAGLAGTMVPAAERARRRWIGRDGRLLAVPGGPVSLLASALLATVRPRGGLLSIGGIVRILRESRVPAGNGGDESIAAFLGRRFGPQVVPLARAMMSGIFAGDADRLEVQSALPLLAAAEREAGSVLRGMRARRRAARSTRAAAPATAPAPASGRRPALLTFHGGMHGLVRHLQGLLGASLRTAAGVTAVERSEAGFVARCADGTAHTAERLVLACPAHASARLLGACAPQLARELAAIPFASVANVHLGLAHDARPQRARGFGFLLEPSAASPLLGVLYCSDVFPEHAPPGQTLLRAMLGGALHAGAVDLDDERLVAIARAEIERHWGRPIEVAFTRVSRVRRAIPQYELGHRARIERIDRLTAAIPGLELRGNSYRGIAVTAQLGSAAAPAAAAPAAATPRASTAARGTA